MNSSRFGQIDQIEHAPAIILLSDIRKNYIYIFAWCCFWISVGIFYLAHTPSTYTAAATVLLEPRRTVQLSMNPNASNYPPTLDSSQADSQIQVIKSERLLRYVFETADVAQYQELKPAPLGPIARARRDLQKFFGSQAANSSGNELDFNEAIFQNFSNGVASRRIGQSYAIEVSYSSTSPNTAASIANSIAMAFIGQQVAVRAAVAEAGAEYLQNRISSFRTQIDAALKGVREGMIQNVQFPDADARIISAALAPTSKAAPVASVIVFAAFAFSLLSALIILSIRSSLSPFARYRTSVSDVTGTECVMFPPARRVWTRAAAASLASKNFRDTFPNYGLKSIYRLDVREFVIPLRSLAARLMSSPQGRSRTRAGVCSWEGTAGCKEIAFNLAALIAPTSGRALFVDASGGDTRSLGLNADSLYGLSDVLFGGANFTEAVQKTELDGLFVLDAASPANKGEHVFFAPTTKWKQFIDNCPPDFDVVIDLGSLKSSPENIGALAALDDIILVVESGKSRSEDLRELCGRLRQFDIKSLNVAFLTREQSGRNA